VPSDAEFEYEQKVCEVVLNWINVNASIVYTGFDSEEADAAYQMGGVTLGKIEVTRDDSTEVLKLSEHLSSLDSPFIHEFEGAYVGTWSVRIADSTPAYKLKRESILESLIQIANHLSICSRCVYLDPSCPEKVGLYLKAGFTSATKLFNSGSMAYLNSDIKFEFHDASSENFIDVVHDYLSEPKHYKKVQNLISRTIGIESHFVLVVGTRTRPSLYRALHDPFQIPAAPVGTLDYELHGLSGFWLVSPYLDLAYCYAGAANWSVYTTRTKQ